MSFDRSPALKSQPTTMRRSDDPDFSRFTEELSVKLFSLTSNIARLSQQINLLGTKRETDRVRERVNDLLDEARTGFKDVGDGVKKLTTWEDLNPSQRYTQQKLSREFQASGTEFQSLQRTAIEKQRASASAARSAVDSGDPTSAPPYSDNDGQQQAQVQEQEQLRLASQDEVDFQESLIIERESEIRNIEQSVGELNELFRDVAHIVREQGDQLNTIDANVENVRGDTRQADVELRSASRYQKASRNKACCLLLILGVVLVIIILAAVLG
ncbi:MAG: hypothetical protein LQ344_001742 [Seirophora lacunosa]|nr:MAG: hypothetical protein LQ344_001742 [Seirophora lacunosa]